MDAIELSTPYLIFLDIQPEDTWQKYDMVFRLKNSSIAVKPSVLGSVFSGCCVKTYNDKLSVTHKVTILTNVSGEETTNNGLVFCLNDGSLSFNSTGRLVGYAISQYKNKWVVYISTALSLQTVESSNPYYFEHTLQAGDIAVSSNTFYTNCVPDGIRYYTFPPNPVLGDKVGFRINGTTDSSYANLLAVIDGVENVVVNANGDFSFVYIGHQWTANLGGINYD
jgi:hypothetical protein